MVFRLARRSLRAGIRAFKQQFDFITVLGNRAHTARRLLHGANISASNAITERAVASSIFPALFVYTRRPAGSSPRAFFGRDVTYGGARSRGLSIAGRR